MHATFTLALAAATVLATTAFAQQPMPDHTTMKQSPAFTQLGTLIGEWEGQTPDGQTVWLSFEIASGGTALIERMHMGAEPEMVTVYHADGDRIAVTHYCSAGNQPQMRTAALAGPVTKLSFDFVRVTNLATPAAGHMRHLTVTLVDSDHLTEEWTWQEGGEAKAQLFRFTRKS